MHVLTNPSTFFFFLPSNYLFFFVYLVLSYFDTPLSVLFLFASTLRVCHCSDEVQALDTMSVRSTVRRKVLNDPQKELQSIINHLEEENRQLQLELMEICGSRAERLQRHRSSIESQLQRLKILKVRI